MSKVQVSPRPKYLTELNILFMHEHEHLSVPVLVLIIYLLIKKKKDVVTILVFAISLLFSLYVISTTAGAEESEFTG